MSHKNSVLSSLLQGLDLGQSVAEVDTVLEAARIETSAFTDLLNDRVDLVPGTKGSGKSALFRIFVDFLPTKLLNQNKVVIAHGVHAAGDPVFHAFLDQFSKLSEEDFVSFWCIYLVSLAHEQFIRDQQYAPLLAKAENEIQKFRAACEKANIPEIKAKQSLKSILHWSLNVLTSWRPKLKYKPPGEGGEFELDLLGSTIKPSKNDLEKSQETLPKYVNDIRESLEAILVKSNLSLWLMVDRLDEIFPRRSDVEKKALRGLLRAMRYFTSESSKVRVKVFLRDDMLEEVTTDKGFTALTHITARQSDTLRWTEEQIRTFIVRRFVASDKLAAYLKLDRKSMNSSTSYQAQCFDNIFPPTVFKGTRQSKTLRWICSRCCDGRGVVTPRDVLYLLIRAKQKQQDIYSADPEGKSDWIIGSAALQYGFEELSKYKRDTYLKAEFPHLWQHIEKFSDGKTSYNPATLQKLFGRNWRIIVDDLASIGFLSVGHKNAQPVYTVPFLYIHGMGLTRGHA